MTRVLLAAAWAFGAVAWVAFLFLYRELFVVAAVLSALATIWWGFRLHPDLHDFTNHHESENHMCDWETTEWRRALNGSTEMERATTEISTRQSVGMCGERDDARHMMGD